MGRIKPKHSDNHTGLQYYFLGQTQVYHTYLSQTQDESEIPLHEVYQCKQSKDVHQDHD